MEVYAVAKELDDKGNIDKVTLVRLNNDVWVDTIHISMTKLKKNLLYRDNFIENLVYSPKNNTLRGKYFSINDLPDRKAMGIRMTAIKVTRSGNVICGAVSNGNFNVLSCNGGNTAGYIVNRKGDTYLCRDERGDTEILDNELKWLLQTVDKKDVVWSLDHFIKYMKYMGYGYNLEHAYGNQAELSLISTNCKVVHIPYGVAKISTLFSKGNVSEDTQIIFPCTLGAVGELYGHRDTKQKKHIRLKSIHFQPTSLIEYKLKKNGFNGKGLWGLDISDECNMPDCGYVYCIYNNCRIRLTGEGSSLSKIEDSFKNLRGSEVKLWCNKISRCFNETKNSKVDLYLADNNESSEIDMTDVFNRCNDIVVDIHNKAEISGSFSYCDNVKGLNTSVFTDVGVSFNASNGISYILKNGILDLTRAKSVRGSFDSKGMDAVKLSSEIQLRHPVGNVSNGKPEITIQFKGVTQKRIKLVMLNDLIMHRRDYGAIKWDNNGAGRKDYELEICTDNERLLYGEKLSELITGIYMKEVKKLKIFDTGVLPGMKEMGISRVYVKTDTLVINDNIEKIADNQVVSLLFYEDKSVLIGKNLAMTNEQLDIARKSMDKSFVYIAGNDKLYGQMSRLDMPVIKTESIDEALRLSNINNDDTELADKYKWAIKNTLGVNLCKKDLDAAVIAMEVYKREKQEKADSATLRERNGLNAKNLRIMEFKETDNPELAGVIKKYKELEYDVDIIVNNESMENRINALGNTYEVNDRLYSKESIQSIRIGSSEAEIEGWEIIVGTFSCEAFILAKNVIMLGGSAYTLGDKTDIMVIVENKIVFASTVDSEVIALLCVGEMELGNSEYEVGMYDKLQRGDIIELNDFYVRKITLNGVDVVEDIHDAISNVVENTLCETNISWGEYIDVKKDTYKVKTVIYVDKATFKFIKMVQRTNNKTMVLRVVDKYDTIEEVLKVVREHGGNRRIGMGEDDRYSMRNIPD